MNFSLKYFHGASTTCVYYLTIAKCSQKNSCGTLKKCESLAQRIFPHLRYSIVNKQDVNKNSNFRKEVGITIKSKETSSQLELVRNSYVAIMYQPVTISSTM